MLKHIFTVFLIDAATKAELVDVSPLVDVLNHHGSAVTTSIDNLASQCSPTSAIQQAVESGMDLQVGCQLFSSVSIIPLGSMF